MFTVMFALGRLPGWIAQWKEMRENKEPIGRPRQIYTGELERDYVGISARLTRKYGHLQTKARHKKARSAKRAFLRRALFQSQRRLFYFKRWAVKLVRRALVGHQLLGLQQVAELALVALLGNGQLGVALFGAGAVQENFQIAALGEHFRCSCFTAMYWASLKWMRWASARVSVVARVIMAGE